MQNTFYFPFPPLKKRKRKRKKKMHECYAMQILEKQRKNKDNQKEWSQRVER